MQTEQQIEQPQNTPVVVPEPQSAQSDESKPKRGGRRPGAGRKHNLSKLLLKGFSREAIAAAKANVDVGVVITSLLKSKREKTRLEALIFVRDTLLGRPAQNVQLSGGVLHEKKAFAKGEGATCCRFLEDMNVLGEDKFRRPVQYDPAITQAIQMLIQPGATVNVATGTTMPAIEDIGEKANLAQWLRTKN